jgi:hypothetical protein
VDSFFFWVPLLLVFVAQFFGINVPKYVTVIQEGINGHPPNPLAQNMGFHLVSFSTVFWS